MRLGWVEIRTRESLSNYCCGQSRLSTGRLIYYLLLTDQRSGKQKQAHLPPVHSFFYLPLSRNGSCSQSIMLCLRCSFIVALCPCSRVASLPQAAVLPERILLGWLPKGCCSSSIAPVWLCTMELIIQEQTVPAQSPTGSSSLRPPAPP